MFIILWVVIRWHQSHISDEELQKKVLSYILVNMIQFMFMAEPRNLQVVIIWVLDLLFQGLFLHDLTFWCSWRSESSRLFYCIFYVFYAMVSGSVTTAWHVLSLRMEEWPPVWRVAANILNKQLRTADKGWSSTLRVWWGANNSSP